MIKKVSVFKAIEVRQIVYFLKLDLNSLNRTKFLTMISHVIFILSRKYFEWRNKDTHRQI